MYNKSMNYACAHNPCIHEDIDIGTEVGTIELSNYTGLLWPQVPCMHATLLISPSLATVST